MPQFLHATSSITSPTGLPLVSSTASSDRYRTIESFVTTGEYADPSGMPINPAQQVDGIRMTDDLPGQPYYSRNFWRNDPGETIQDQTVVSPGRGSSFTEADRDVTTQAMMNLHDSANWSGFIPMQGGYTEWQAGELAGNCLLYTSPSPRDS